jgi:hypothetical protein
MIENRMIGKGAPRIGHHAGAMGESHGDLFGMEIVNEFGLAPSTARTATPSPSTPPGKSSVASGTSG